jgi:hypothetical protein
MNDMENSGIFKTTKRYFMELSDYWIVTEWYGEHRDFQNWMAWRTMRFLKQ